VMPVMAAAGSIAGQALASTVGLRTVAAVGFALTGLGCLLLTSVSVGGTYLGDIFFGLLAFGPGLGAAYVAGSIGSLAGVAEADAGLASGLNNSAFQIGGAIGVAVVSSVAVSQAHGADPLGALTNGLQSAFASAIAFAAAGPAGHDRAARQGPRRGPSARGRARRCGRRLTGALSPPRSFSPPRPTGTLAWRATTCRSPWRRTHTSVTCSVALHVHCVVREARGRHAPGLELPWLKLGHPLPLVVHRATMSAGSVVSRDPDRGADRMWSLARSGTVGPRRAMSTRATAGDRRAIALTTIATLLAMAIVVVLVADRVFFAGGGRTGARGSGIAATEARAVPRFTTIELTGGNNVVVQVGTRQSVVVHADSNLLGRVTTRVRSGTLRIGTTPGELDATSPMFVAVSLPSLAGLRLPGQGTISVTGIDARHFTVALPGSGEIDATGTATRLDVTLGGAGSALLRRLVARDASARLEGDGTIMLTATHSVAAKVSGQGTIVYGGNPPHVSRSVTGSGTIGPE
jgi:Putative auto-transporter adhesin, head GIN domain